MAERVVESKIHAVGALETITVFDGANTGSPSFESRPTSEAVSRYEVERLLIDHHSKIRGNIETGGIRNCSVNALGGGKGAGRESCQSLTGWSVLKETYESFLGRRGVGKCGNARDVELKHARNKKTLSESISSKIDP